MAFPWAAAAVAAPVVSSLLGGSKKQKQEPLETPEQRAARRKLMGFAETGQFGDFKAGEEMDLGYGDYGMTGIEGQGLSSLQSLLQSGIPDQYRLGDEALRDLLETSPGAIDRQFQPVQDLVARRTRDSNDALKREAAFGGSLYSTDTVRRLGDIEARGTETLTAAMADLVNRDKDRRLAAIPLAYQSAESQQGARLGQVAASQAYGGLARQLNDRRIKERDSELLRRRSELQLPIQAATSVAGGAPTFGVPEVEVSPYQELLGMVGQIGGQYLGNELFLDQYRRKFPGPSGYGAR